MKLTIGERVFDGPDTGGAFGAVFPRFPMLAIDIVRRGKFIGGVIYRVEVE
jgi:hypothetical protein